MIYLDRFKSDRNGTFGALVDDLGRQLCFTCELPWNDNQRDISCIPGGAYQVEAFQSPKHGDIWRLMNVPGRSNIEIHAGNDIVDLRGCICVGDALGTVNSLPAVLRSVDTLKLLKTTLPSSFQLTIGEYI